jgi:uncharacterized protein
MTIAPELLSMLRCPRCKGQLRVIEGERPTLDCAACRLRYPVRDGIPIMLIDEAAPL